jgi:hypothetical protein
VFWDPVDAPKSVPGPVKLGWNDESIGEVEKGIFDEAR